MEPHQRKEYWQTTEIPHSDIIFHELIGTGAFGDVYKAKCRETFVAVKVLKRVDKSNVQQFRTEMETMRRTTHQNIVMYYGACTEDEHLMVVMELMHTDCDKWLHGSIKPGAMLCLEKARDAAIGMDWLHSICKIVHRDLKPGNILLDEDMHVKIGDFGFAESYMPHTLLMDHAGPRGTIPYMAPEVLSRRPFSQAADVYSFGMVLLEFATYEKPWAKTHAANDPKAIVAAVLKGDRPPIPESVNHKLAALIRTCWAQEPQDRPSFQIVMRELDEILMAVTITNPDAARFWRANFGVPFPKTVEWETFQLKLTRHLNVDPGQLGRLHEYITQLNKRNQLEVAAERLDLFVTWFGNFLEGMQATAILWEMVATMNQPWFFSDSTTREKAVSLLSLRPDKFFLIRLSTSQPELYPFTLSWVMDLQPIHCRIERIATDVSQDERLGLHIPKIVVEGRFRNLSQMVSDLVERIILSKPCPRTPSQIASTYFDKDAIETMERPTQEKRPTDKSATAEKKPLDKDKTKQHHLGIRK